MELAPRQIKLLKRALENKELTLSDFKEFYSTIESGRNAMERFTQFGLIRESGQFGKFGIDEEKIKKELENVQTRI